MKPYISYSNITDLTQYKKLSDNSPLAVIFKGARIGSFTIFEESIPIDESSFWDNYDHMFIQIPKTATRSIVVTIPDKYQFGHIYGSEYPKRIKHKLRSIVRNPYDRLVSAYFFMLRGGFGITLEYVNFKEKYRTFDDWILKGLTADLLNRKNRPNWKEPFYPQYYWLCDENDDLVIDKVNIGRFEKLDEDVERLFGFKLTAKHNVSTDRDRDWTKYYTNKEVVAKVNELYDKDFSLFGYDKM